MKYVLLLIPVLKYGVSFLENTKTIELNSVNISVINVLERMRFDNVINLIVSLIITYILLKNIKVKNNYRNLIVNAIFIVYINELYNLVSYIYVSEFFRPIISTPHLVDGALNLIPFKNISLILWSKATFIQVIGNALILSPLAFFVHYYKWSNKYSKTFVLLFGLIIFIEVLQLFQTYIYSMYTTDHIRACDIDDIILNSISVITGIIVFNVYDKIRSKNNMKRFKPCS